MQTTKVKAEKHILCQGHKKKDEQTELLFVNMLFCFLIRCTFLVYGFKIEQYWGRTKIKSLAKT